MDEDKSVKKAYLKMFLVIMATALITTGILIGIAAYYIINVNPFNIQACLITSVLKPSETASTEAGENEGSGPGSTADAQPGTKTDHPLLSESQETVLEEAGIDVGTLPETISPQMEACFEEKLGSQRVEEIKAGSELGPMDILRGSSCL